ncbi:TIGR04255 family protein [Mycobacteroides franklinii]|uniref:TIGR04255 family protein n=1 Tax=Mycobacteroides franklinii TaxID=948102 RepID=UPI0009936F7E|nr:TIGR04255 family protein [Mycobacteroides franklinii]
MSAQDAHSDPFVGLVGLVAVGRQYANAPIIEATIDLRVTLSDEVDLEVLSGLYDDLDPPRPFYEFVPKVENDRVVASDDQRGYRYLSKGQFAVTAGLDRFAYSQLSTYDGWDTFAGNVVPRWESYKAATTPGRITNVGVRYVNRIVIPKAPVEINDYLRTTVDISPYLPQSINRYFAQISFPISAFGAEATVTTTLDNPPVPEATALILDIDVFKGVELDPFSDSFSDELTEVFDTLRKAKNYVFEACITDATRGVIDRGVHESGASA